MILRQLAIVTLAALTTAFLVAVLFLVLRNTYALLKFKWRSKLFVIPDFSLLDGHVSSLVFRRRIWQEIGAGHLQYGKTFAWFYGHKPAVCTIDLDLIKQIVIDEPNAHVNRIELKMPVYEYEYNSIVFAKDEQWRRIRRALAPALASHKFKTPNVTAEINGSISKLISLIERRLNEAEAREKELDRGQEMEEQKDGGGCLMNMDDTIHRYSLDLVFSCLYKQYKQIDFEAKQDHWTHMVDSGLRRQLHNPIFKVNIMFPILEPLVDWLVLNFSELGFMRSNIMRFIKLQTKSNFMARQQMQKYEESGEMGRMDEENLILEDGTKFKRNMIDHFTDQFHEGKLTTEEYFNSSFFLFLAADRTSADSITKLIYHLGLYDQVQEKLRKSVLVEGPESEYLSWVINESMRLLPPVLVGCSRTITRDIETKEGLIPDGTFVLTPVYTIHRLPEYWGKDANEFKPERWANAKSFHPMQFLPFGAGKRSCPGKEFALHEMKMLMTELLKRYRFDAQPQPDLFDSPYFIFTVFDLPTQVKVVRL